MTRDNVARETINSLSNEQLNALPPDTRGRLIRELESGYTGAADQSALNKINSSYLADPAVKSGMAKAAVESNIGGPDPVEQGGFIVRDPETGRLDVERWPMGEQAEMEVVLSPDGKSKGKDIVGSFHTHPNVGPGWIAEPSGQDVKLVQDYPQTAGQHHYVISKDKVFHIDHEGDVSDVGPTHTLSK